MAKKKEPEPYDYAVGGLFYWLALETWSPQEALCLLSGIDPRFSEINWDGFLNALGVKVPIPTIEVAFLLDQSWGMRDLPDGVAERRRRMKRMWQHPAHIVHLELATTRLRKNWDAYSRDPKTKIDEKNSPNTFIAWAQKKGIDIPWLDWADENGLMPSAGKKSPNTNAKKRSALSSSDQIGELREAAVQIAIRRHVNDGMPKKNITVKRICQWLIDSGKFSTGESFSIRWRETEGMRSHLKKPNNPRSDKRFLQAKPMK